MTVQPSRITKNTVFLARGGRRAYQDGAPEALVRMLLAEAGLDSSRYGSDRWNPLSDLIGPGDKVVIKPNWVYHENRSGRGMDCMVTHTAVIAAILEYVVAASPAEIVIGDAPIQGCDFQSLCRQVGVDDLLSRFGSRARISIRDFRATKRAGDRFAAPTLKSRRGMDEFVEFDLGASSWLEPVTTEDAEFRVTMYDPQALKKTHARARHRYLVAREVMDADVVINVPKLKTHKKAGITGALKNVVGINGLKDYLPHHRKGSAESGGDCYARKSAFKTAGEACLDAANRSDRQRWIAAVLGGAARVATRLDEMFGGDRNMEGGWHGNDTVWRTVLDLQRILNFGKSDSTVDSSPQRRVIHITDAIVAGEGDGPLYPSPVPLGVMTMALDPAAAEWVHALLMGFDPQKIPLVAYALDEADLHPTGIRIHRGGEPLTCEQLAEQGWPSFQAPSGWAGHCELSNAKVAQLC
jgi:uncharacterized protein (DUF362 family)